MKRTLTLLAASLLSLSAAAVESQTILLEDGSTASILSQNGKNTSYIKEAKPGADGKVQSIPGQVFDGKWLVKKADGQCLSIRQRLVSLDTVSVGGWQVQLPKTTMDANPASCNS